MSGNKTKSRKATLIFAGVLQFFPDALAEVAKASTVGGVQYGHFENAPRWDRSKSLDDLESLTRHLVDRGAGVVRDDDGVRSLAKVAWRALAALQREIERERVVAVADMAPDKCTELTADDKNSLIEEGIKLMQTEGELDEEESKVRAEELDKPYTSADWRQGVTRVQEFGDGREPGGQTAEDSELNTIALNPPREIS